MHIKIYASHQQTFPLGQACTSLLCTPSFRKYSVQKAKHRVQSARRFVQGSAHCYMKQEKLCKHCRCMPTYRSLQLPVSIMTLPQISKCSTHGLTNTRTNTQNNLLPPNPHPLLQMLRNMLMLMLMLANAACLISYVRATVSFPPMRVSNACAWCKPLPLKVLPDCTGCSDAPTHTLTGCSCHAMPMRVTAVTQQRSCQVP